MSQHHTPKLALYWTSPEKRKPKRPQITLRITSTTESEELVYITRLTLYSIHTRVFEF